MRFIAILVIVCFGQALNSQTYSSRNNFTGDWMSPATWNYAWSSPSATVNGTNLNIYGYVSLHDNLSISGTLCTLTVYDTLVIYGNLFLGNNIYLNIRDNALVIVKGSLTISTNTNIVANGYMIMTGDLSNTSEIYFGSFLPGIPSRVFFGGTVPQLDLINYPVLDCDNPFWIQFEHSGCTYGNTADLMEDPVYPFFISTCRTGVSVSSNSPLCENEELQLTARGGLQYQWSGPSGYRSNQQNPVIQNTSASSSGIYLVQISSPGCIITDTVFVMVKPRPVVSLNINTPVCEGHTIYLSASGAEEYQWSGPDSFVSTLASPSINGAQPSMQGKYTVKGITNGCEDTDSAILAVNPVPLVSASVTSPVCEGTLVSFSATGAGDYEWNGPDNFSSNESNPGIPDVKVKATGIYIVQGFSLGCTNSDTVFLEINPSPGLSVSNNGPFCEGDHIELKASGGKEFQWTGPSGFQSNEQNPVIPDADPAHSGEYFVKSITSAGCSDSVVVSLIVKPYPEAFAGEDIILEDENQTHLYADGIGYEKGEWTILSGSGVFSNRLSPVSLLSELPEGESRLKWTTSNGHCTASDEVVITVIPLFIPNVITPNSDGKNDHLVISALGENAELIVFNRMGITVYSTTNYANDWNGVNNAGNDLPDDTYYYVLKTGKGHIHKGSILIKRR